MKGDGSKSAGETDDQREREETLRLSRRDSKLQAKRPLSNLEYFPAQGGQRFRGDGWWHGKLGVPRWSFAVKRSSRGTLSPLIPQATCGAETRLTNVG